MAYLFCMDSAAPMTPTSTSTSPGSDEIDITDLTAVLEICRRLSKDGRRRLIETITTFFGVATSSLAVGSTPSHRSQVSGQVLNILRTALIILRAQVPSVKSRQRSLYCRSSRTQE